ncbi:MAG: hypothetical protein Q7S53_02540 [bacterium]|nr:hypothetical protein [bacterium]
MHNIMILVNFLPSGKVRKETWALLLKEYEYLALKETQENPELIFLKTGYLHTIIKRKTGYTDLSLANFKGRAPKRVAQPGEIEQAALALGNIDTFQRTTQFPPRRKEPALI